MSRTACTAIIFTVLSCTGPAMAGPRIQSAAPAVTGASARVTRVVLAVRRVGPAVLNIFTRKIVRSNPFGIGVDPGADMPFVTTRKVTSLGSGVIIDSRHGYAVTNEHVLSRAIDIKVQLADNRVFPARLVGADRRFDIAVLKIETNSRLPSARLGTSSDLMPGETAIAIGNPYGLSHTVSVGVISALHRRLKIRGRIYEDFIQTDAAINPGNSGGPLLNVLGEVIGINSAIHRGGSGIGFAIPIDRIKQAIADLLRYGKVRKAYLGMTLKPYRGPGLLVTALDPKGPAARAGIHVGDVVLAVRGKALLSQQDLTDAVSRMIPGERIPFRLRKGRVMVRVSAIKPYIAWRNFQLDLGLRFADASVKAQAMRLATRTGAVITYVRRDGPAWSIGLRPGDVILEINGHTVRTLNDLYRHAINIRLNSSLTMIIQRGTKLYRATMAY